MIRFTLRKYYDYRRDSLKNETNNHRLEKFILRNSLIINRTRILITLDTEKNDLKMTCIEITILIHNYYNK